MQTAVPEVMQLSGEPAAIERLYGLDQDVTRGFGQMCLSARRMVERGVRFVQVFHGSNGGAGAWDAHSGLRQNHAAQCAQVDKPIAGLLTDLKQRGLLDETIVVWATEFGRTPGSEGKDGRDHHPYGFSVWMAGGGIKGGIVHGATDEIGYHAVVNRHYVTDIHATLLHQLGLDPLGSRCPATSGWKSISARSFATSWRDRYNSICMLIIFTCENCGKGFALTRNLRAGAAGARIAATSCGFPRYGGRDSRPREAEPMERHARPGAESRACSRAGGDAESRSVQAQSARVKTIDRSLSAGARGRAAPPRNRR